MPPFEWCGVDLKDAILVDWLTACVALPVHRAYVLTQIASKYGRSHGHWLSNESISPRSLVDLIGSDKVDISCESLAPRLVGQLGSITKTVREKAWHFREAWRTRRLVAEIGKIDVPYRPLVFADYFTNSARLSVQLAKATRDALDNPVAFLAARREVYESVASKWQPSWYLHQFSHQPTSSERRAYRDLEQRLSGAGRELAITWPELANSGNPLPRSLIGAIVRIAMPLLRVAASQVSCIMRMCDELKPVGLVTTTFSSTFGRALALAGTAQGIPCIYVQHGMLAKHVTRRLFPKLGDSRLGLR